MHLTHLSLTNFRAFSRLDMEVPRHILLLVGDNAQGKTTLLEAVYFLATFTSFHAAHDRQLINFLAEEENLPFARVVADFQRGGKPHRLEIRLIQDAVGANGARLRKEILVDGVKRSMQDAMGSFNAVLFLPQMTQILEGGPDERRRYLNLTLSQIVPGYAQALTEYVQVVAQRNALLKQLAERGGDSEQLTYWDTLLVQRGAYLIQARIRALNELERLSARIHDRLTEGKEVLRLVYRPGYDPAVGPRTQYSLPIETTVDRSGFTEEQIREGFLARLRMVRAEEIQRGVTTIGPHRDEVRFTANGIDLGDFGSRGQVRTALMALKLAEVAWMREKIGEWPVLLLDETLAELDIQRRADLLNALGDCDQAVLTTTDLNLFNEAFVRQCTIWQVQAGCVQRVDQPA
ncbi:MAG: DNA replication and repair protein RecF [Chloroflexota bacterium]|nr:MAG: DNA replication and repair protein RecF [Bellilinea sp.]